MKIIYLRSKHLNSLSPQFINIFDKHLTNIRSGETSELILPNRLKETDAFMQTLPLKVYFKKKMKSKYILRTIF